MARNQHYGLLFFLLVACGRPASDKLADEFRSLLEVESQNRIEEAEAAHNEIYQWSQNERWPETVRATAREYIEKTNIDEVHAIATRFYAFVGSFRQAHESSGNHSMMELLERYKLSVDSILTLTPEIQSGSTDYSKAEQSKYLELICPQLVYDMALLEKRSMNSLAESLPTIFYDEFPDWGADTLRVSGFLYVRIKRPQTGTEVPSVPY